MQCKKKTLAAAVAALIVTGLAIQASAGVIASWDFDAKDISPTQGACSPSQLVDLPVLVGGVMSVPNFQWIPGIAPTVTYPSYAWDTTNYPAQSTNNRTAGIEFAVSTIGYTGIHVSFAQQHTADASRYTVFEYTVNGGFTWSDAVAGSTMDQSDVDFVSYSFDLSAIASVDNNPIFRFRILTIFDPNNPTVYAPTLPAFAYAGGSIAWENVEVTGTRSETVYGHYIKDVPDVNQPCANPLSLNGFNNVNFCAPTSALNITEYWDIVQRDAAAIDVDGNVNPGPTSVLQFIGWWMSTNDDAGWAGQKCPFRSNGHPTSFTGTALTDIAPGLTQYVRWDAADGFWSNPPALLGGKTGHDWKVELFKRQPTDPPLWDAGWAKVKAEIDLADARPLIGVYSWWNPIGPLINYTEGFTYYSQGPVLNAPPPGAPQENWDIPDVGGHAVTIVGYRENSNYPPDNIGWIIAHDNWSCTDRDVAIPWRFWDGNKWTTPCAALITVDPSTAPIVGTLTASTAGGHDPGNHNTNPGCVDVVAQINFAADATEDIAINAITLAAAGTGDDRNDIASIDLVDDANNDGSPAGDKLLTSHNGGYSADNGTVTFTFPGYATYRIPASTSRNMLVVYHFLPIAPVGNNYSFTASAILATGCTYNLQCTTVPNPFTFASGTVTLATATVNPGVHIGDMKQMTDGLVFYRDGLPPEGPVVIDSTSGYYAQEPDGSAGIRFTFAGGPPSGSAAGQRIQFQGMLYTAQGERFLRVTSAYITTPGPQKVVAMPVKSVGGGNWHWDPVMHTGQQGVAGGVGLNNVGLLVRTYGKYAKVSSTLFTVDDGSGAALRCYVPSSVTLQTYWTDVIVTGVSSVETISGELKPCLRVRFQSDIVPI
jgi:hypothetical protein